MNSVAAPQETNWPVFDEIRSRDYKKHQKQTETKISLTILRHDRVFKAPQVYNIICKKI